MMLRLTDSIVRVLRGEPRQNQAHFHTGSDGRPYVCDYDRCESPSLSGPEVGLPRR